MERDLGRRDIQPRVGGYGVIPLGAAHLSGDNWQVNFKLPPGLKPGWHDVTVAVRGGPENGAARIAVDVPLPPSSPRIEGLCDGTTWTRDALDLARGRILSLWCAGLPQNADRANLRVTIDGIPCRAEVDGAAAISNPVSRQVNVTVPASVSAGHSEVTLRIGESVSEPVPVEIRGA